MSITGLLIFMLLALWVLGGCLLHEHLAYDEDGDGVEEWNTLPFTTRYATYILWPGIVCFILWSNHKKEDYDD